MSDYSHLEMSKEDKIFHAGYDDGFKAGVEAMRERAAKECDFHVCLFHLYGETKPEIISALDATAAAIRALPVEE